MKTYTTTLQLLFTAPRQVIDYFLSGKSSPYSHPFLFCLMGSVIVVLLNNFLGDFSINPNIDESAAESESLVRLAEWTQIVSVRAATQFLPFSMFIVLIISLAVGGVIFLRKEAGGFYDHIVINSYAVGATFPVLLLLIPVWRFAGQSLLDPLMNTTIPAVVVAAIILWIYRLYFNPSSFSGMIKTLSAYITGYVIYVFLLGFLASVTGYMIFAIERLAEITA